MSNPVIDQGYGFAVYPSVSLYGYKMNKKTKQKEFVILKTLLFGDYIKPAIEHGDYVSITEKKKTYIKVHCRSKDGYILPNNIQPDRIVEINITVVGQGDGCHIVSEDDNHFIVDAGSSDNMFRFIKWRFNLSYSENTPPEFTGIITHSDTDHYRGFYHLFAKNDTLKHPIVFKKVFHNGLVETSGKSLSTLGTVIKQDNNSFITDLCETDQQFKNLTLKDNSPGLYISTLLESSAPKESVRYKRTIYKGILSTLDVIGPISQNINGKEALPVFEKDKGKTKNGNSVVLMLTVGKLKFLLGGDLNSASEDYLLQQYSGIDVPAIKAQLKETKLTKEKRNQLYKELDMAISLSNKTIGADIVKSCHHGSSDVTPEFLKAINPIVTIISSGDDEAYFHPRPDTLGIVGKLSRGERPLIYSTELARSSKEYVRVTTSSLPKDKIRTVTVYGMICVRADNDRAIIATKLEDRSGWFIRRIEWDKKTNQFISIP